MDEDDGKYAHPSIPRFLPQRELDVDAIRCEIEAGYISEQRHPAAPLRILNYTPKTQFEWRWNQETMQCRGLVVGDDYSIVARPFPKFFSYDQLQGVVPQEAFEVYDKLDGSLGVLYRANGQTYVSSRGSFTSEQSERANAIFRRKYAGIPLDESLTYVFEIIYPENRIVVNYGDLEDLVLLAIIDTATGEERPLVDLGFPVVRRFDGIHDFAELLRRQDDDREGFVVKFASGQRVKIKFDEYKRLHKLLTGITPRRIWDTLRRGGDMNELIEQVPDEFFGWVRSVEADLRKRYAEIETDIRAQFAATPRFEHRKAAAEYFRNMEFPSIMFAMLDGKDYSDHIWRLLRPSEDEAFRADDEG